MSQRYAFGAELRPDRSVDRTSVPISNPQHGPGYALATARIAACRRVGVWSGESEALTRLLFWPATRGGGFA